MKQWVAANALRSRMGTSMVLPMAFCLSLPLWAREGTPLAPTQSPKQAQLLRYNQKSEVGLFSQSSARLCQHQSHHLQTLLSLLLLPGLPLHHALPPFLCTSSFQREQRTLITFSPLVPVVLHLYLKLLFLMLLPRLFQIYMVFLILLPRCCQLCKIVLPKRCPILFSNRLWSLTVSCLTPTGHP